MDPRSSEPDWDSMDEDDGVAPRFFGRQKSLVDEGMKGDADPLLSQEPASVLPSYASLMDTDVGQDFSEDKLMNSGNLYSLFLLNSDSTDDISLTNGQASPLLPDLGVRIKKETSDDEEEIDVENDTGKNETSSASPRKRKASVSSQLQENGHKPCDALFEGMPFYELQGKEFGPCAYCSMWRTIRYMSYCGRYPFCSVNCTKKFAVCKREKGELLEKVHEDDKHVMKLKVPTLFEEHKPRPLFPANRRLSENGSKSPCNGIHGNIKHDSSLRFDWPAYLEEQDMEAAPVKCFHHAALSKEWKANLIGALVEVHNRDPDDSKDSFWVARIIKVAGYKAKMRFEGYGMDNSHDFWVHLCKTECYAINGAVNAGMKLKPPKGVMERLGDKWLEHLARISHSGSQTYSTPRDKLKESFNMTFKKDMKLEVVYKRQVSSTCVATVKNVVGDRIHVQYDNCKDPSKDFWFHRMSPLIHPVGWSQRVGHPLVATAAYKSEALDKGRQRRGGPHDAPWEIFHFPQPVKQDQSFRVGMKLEVIDPLKLSHICVGTVMRVLDEGYLMIGVDGCLADHNSWFCYHSNSPSLLPVGFCEYHHIDLVPPKDFLGNFDWDDYLRNTNSVAAPVELFHQKTTNPGFKVGHKLEAVDLIESGLICAATIVKMAGPLIRVHFDGWDSAYDQWVDCQIPDIYPVGWCEMVGYPLQPPRMNSMLDYTAPVPVFKHNGKKIKISPGLRPDNKKRRSLSISLTNFAASKPSETNLDSIYSFSDDEGMSGYQELLKTPAKQPQINKKEKKEKKEKKSSKPKHHKNHHHHHHKQNGKPESMMEFQITSESELKHLLTTINVNPSSLTPQATPKSSPKSDVAIPPPKKHKKSKSSKKDKHAMLSKSEASILDGIFAAMNKEAELYAKMNSAKSKSNATPSGSSDQNSMLMESTTLPPRVTISSATLNVQSPVVDSNKSALQNAHDVRQQPPIIHSQILQKTNRPEETTCTAQEFTQKTELTPPTLNKMPDVPLSHVASFGDSLNEMPPLIPAGEPEPSPIPDTNKFQDAFILQLAKSLKATKSKTEKNSKSKPKKARVKDKDKESSKKSSKKEGKDGKCKKEAKLKKKTLCPPKPKTSHLAELLKRPGSLDLSNIDPKKMVNGFYVAGASGSGGVEKTDTVVHSMLQSPTSVADTAVHSKLQSPTSVAEIAVHSMLQNQTSVAETAIHSMLQNPTSVAETTVHSMLRSPTYVSESAMHSMLQSPTSVAQTPTLAGVTSLLTTTAIHNRGDGKRKSLLASQQTFGDSQSVQNPFDQKVFSSVERQPLQQAAPKPDNKNIRLMSPVNQTVMQSFDSMEDDILQNCIDPNLLHKPSNRAEQRSRSMDIGMLHRESKPIQEPPVTDVYQFMPNSEVDSIAPTTSSKKTPATKSKAKPKPKPKPKKKKAANSNTKPVPRGRSNSVPSSNVQMEAQKFLANGMSLEMMQDVLSPGSSANNDTLLELERTQQHIVSSILHDHAHQSASPEQLFQRQRAAMIMQEKFRELQQLQMRMQMSQNTQAGQRPSMPPLVELRRPPIHMRFPGPQHAMMNSTQVQQQQLQQQQQMQEHQQQQQIQQQQQLMQQQQMQQQQMQQQINIAGLQMPSSSAATMMASHAIDPRLTSPRHGQPMTSPSSQASLPPLSPQQSPNPQMHCMVPSSPKSMMVPSPKARIPSQSPKSKLPPPSPKSMPVPSPKAMLPNSPTSMPPPSPSMPPPSPSMPPPSPQSGPSSSSSMMAVSPQSMMPPSPQAPMGPNLQARLSMPQSPQAPMGPNLQARLSMPQSPQNPMGPNLQARLSMPPSPQTPMGSNLQARLQQTSPTPGPTSPIMMMQGRSHTAGMTPNQRLMTAQAMMQQSNAMIQQHNMPTSPCRMMPQVSPQPMLSPRGVLSPRYPSTSQSLFGSVPPGDRNPFAYRSPLPSPQSSPTGVPTQRLPPMHSLIRPSMHQMPPSPHGMSASLPSPGSNPASSPVQSPHPSPNNMHLPNQVFQRGIPGNQNPIPPHQNMLSPGHHRRHAPDKQQLSPGQHQMLPGQMSPGQHQMSPGQHQMSPGQHHMLPGQYQGNVPIHQMSRPGGFPVGMGYPSPPPGYVSATAGSIPRRPAPVSKQDSSTELQSANQQSPNKSSIGIMNPWEWSISDVIRFIADAGEAGCAEPFRRQKIDGPKFMSLSKDQLANLTGMKVAPSLKIYQQIVRLRSMFPAREQANNQVNQQQV